MRKGSVVPDSFGVDDLVGEAYVEEYHLAVGYNNAIIEKSTFVCIHCAREFGDGHTDSCLVPLAQACADAAQGK